MSYFGEPIVHLLNWPVNVLQNSTLYYSVLLYLLSSQNKLNEHYYVKSATVDFQTS